MAASDFEIEALSLRKPSLTERTRALLVAARDLKTQRAYRRLFLHDGKLTRDGALVLADLAKAAALGKVRPGASGEELNFREGRRALFLHITAKFDARNVALLANRMREMSNDRTDTES